MPSKIAAAYRRLNVFSAQSVAVPMMMLPAAVLVRQQPGKPPAQDVLLAGSRDQRQHFMGHFGSRYRGEAGIGEPESEHFFLLRDPLLGMENYPWLRRMVLEPCLQNNHIVLIFPGENLAASIAEIEAVQPNGDYRLFRFDYAYDVATTLKVSCREIINVGRFVADAAISRLSGSQIDPEQVLRKLIAAANHSQPDVVEVDDASPQVAQVKPSR